MFPCTFHLSFVFSLLRLLNSLTFWFSFFGTRHSKYLDGIITQTTLAHRLLLKAWKLGGQQKQQALLTVLFKGYFEELVNIGDTDVLADAAVRAGLFSRDEVRLFLHYFSSCGGLLTEVLAMTQAVSFLESDECLDEVETMMTEARRKGVNGVPFVVIDGKWAVSGGQTAEVYTQVRTICHFH